MIADVRGAAPVKDVTEELLQRPAREQGAGVSGIADAAHKQRALVRRSRLG